MHPFYMHASIAAPIGAVSPLRSRVTLRRLRPLLIASVVVFTFATPATLGTVAVSAYASHQVEDARGSITRAHMEFGLQVTRSLSEGTPKALLDSLVGAEAARFADPLPAAAFAVDRVRLLAMQQRATDLRDLKHRVQGVETQVEIELHQQFLDTLKALRADITPAKELGVDTTDYLAFADATLASHAGLSTPNAGRDLVAAVQARDKGLRDATDTKRQQLQAFQSAQSSARAALRRAQSTLAQAKAITALKIDDIAAAIATLTDRLAAAVTTSDYQSVGAGLNTQAGLLDQLLQARSDAYGIRDKAKAHLFRAQQVGIDMSAESPKLDQASWALDAAGDLAGIGAARDQIQAVKNTIDVKYNLAIYGGGKVIVISIQNQELEALQDGVILQDTLITSGRPALPTPVGSWWVMRKYSPYEMISPWPKGSPYYYNPSWVQMALLFHDGGYFVHDAPWRSHYGPGSDSEFGGTHGCVNVPAGSMTWLFGWAPVGTLVDVVAGDF